MKRLYWEAKNRAERRRKKAFEKEKYRKQKRANRRLQVQGSGKKQNQPHKISFENHVHIELPVKFDLYSNYDKTLDMIDELRETALHKKRNVLLSFREIKEIHPASMLCLVAEIDRCNRVNPKKLEITGTYPEDNVVEVLLEVMGFFDLLKKQKRRLFPENDLPIKIIKFISNIGAKGVDANRLKNRLLSDLPRKKVPWSTPLYRNLVEAMTNVGHHAYPDEIQNQHPFLKGRWWMVGAIDPDKMLTAIFYDQGVGIPKTAPINYKESKLETVLKKLVRERQDGEIIHSVITKGETQTKEKYRGKGLRDMARRIDTIGGNSRFRVLSGYGDYTYIPASLGEPIIKNNKKSLCGTLIEWKIPLNSIIMENDQTNR